MVGALSNGNQPKTGRLFQRCVNSTFLHSELISLSSLLPFSTSSYLQKCRNAAKYSNFSDVMENVVSWSVSKGTRILHLRRCVISWREWPFFKRCVFYIWNQSHTYIHQDLREPLNLRLNTPKLHFLHAHFIDSIRDKGLAQNTSTSFGEACHPQSKEDFKLTNRQSNTFQATVCFPDLVSVVSLQLIQMLKVALRR